MFKAGSFGSAFAACAADAATRKTRPQSSFGSGVANRHARTTDVRIITFPDCDPTFIPIAIRTRVNATYD
ncbi:hypothetical protein [Lysobacter sp. TAB13]|uniref:hypothetical protein n=1 Tax=Lysobacter sp. TAB13 TaxID=3233065 RepID=UPI003F98E591